MLASDLGRQDQIAPHFERQGGLLVAMTCLVVFGLGYFFSHWLLLAYSGGDQIHYANFWQAMTWTHPSLWNKLQLQYVSSTEPLYRYTIGFGTYFGFDRLVYLSLWNALFLSLIAYALIKHKASILFSLFAFTNYYVFVLLAPAERLKFSFILLLLAFVLKDIKWRSLSAVLSVLAHNQAAVQVASASMYYVVRNWRKIVSSRVRIAVLFTLGPVLLVFAGYVVLNSSGDVISQKAEFYVYESQGIIETFQWLIILVTGIIAFNFRLHFIVGMLPMGVLTAIYGGRVNVATLAFFCAIALLERKTANPLVLFVMAYMSFKTIGFVSKVLVSGQGF